MQAFPATGCALSSLLYAQIAILDEVKSTQLGYGLGLALGAKMAAPEKHVINVMGGSLSIGHPFGATGGRITVTVLNEMARRDIEFGLITVCAAGGMGFAMVVERR